MLKWINDNQTLAEIIFNVGWAILGIFFAYATFYYSSRRKQRAAAIFSFYVRFYFRLSILQALIEKDTEEKNPYNLMYTDFARRTKQCCLPEKTPSESFEKYMPIAKEIKELLLNTDGNVYPRWFRKKHWYQKQLVVLEFVMLITDRLGCKSINDAADSVPKDKLSSLTDAVSDLLQELMKKIAKE